MQKGCSSKCFQGHYCGRLLQIVTAWKAKITQQFTKSHSPCQTKATFCTLNCIFKIKIGEIVMKCMSYYSVMPIRRHHHHRCHVQNHAKCPDPIVFPTVAANLRTTDTDLDDIEADGETEIKEAEETD
jgi:hypothetical protein